MFVSFSNSIVHITIAGTLSVKKHTFLFFPYSLYVRVNNYILVVVDLQKSLLQIFFYQKTPYYCDILVTFDPYKINKNST